MITPNDLPPGLLESSELIRQKANILSVHIGASVEEVEKALIIATLKSCEGRKAEAASILGVSMKTLYNRLHKYENQEGGGVKSRSNRGGI